MVSNAIARRAPGRLARLLVTVVGFGVISAAPGQAQWFGYRDAPIPPGAIVRSLMRQGFIDIGAPRFDGSVYVVDGITARGARVRLVIDAYDGDVLSRTRLERPILPPRDIGPPRGRSGDPFEEADEFGPPRPAPWTGRYDPREAEPPRRVERPVRPPPERKTARAEPPTARGPGTSAPTAEQPKAAPTAPAGEAAAPKPRPSEKPGTRAAAAPVAPKPDPKPAPASPQAPAPSVDLPKSAGSGEAQAKASEAPARSVRVIEGVTPVLPQADEAPKVTVEPPPDIVPPVALE